MFRVKVYKEQVYEFMPDLVLCFDTLEEAEMFASIVVEKAAQLAAVHIEMDRKVYGPKEEKEIEE